MMYFQTEGHLPLSPENMVSLWTSPKYIQDAMEAGWFDGDIDEEELERALEEAFCSDDTERLEKWLGVPLDSMIKSPCTSILSIPVVLLYSLVTPFMVAG